MRFETKNGITKTLSKRFYEGKNGEIDQIE